MKSGKIHTGLIWWSIAAVWVMVAVNLPGVASSAVDSFCTDVYEVDNTFPQATPIFINDTRPQRHNFHEANDADWVSFGVLAGQTLEVTTHNCGAYSNPCIDLYAGDGETLLRTECGADEMGEVKLSFKGGQKPRTYYARIRPYAPDAFGAGSDYDLSVTTPTAPDFTGYVKGLITDAISGHPLNAVTVRTSGGAVAAPSTPQGAYLLSDTAGSYAMTATKSGYLTYKDQVTILSGQIYQKDFRMIPTNAPDLIITSLSGPVAAQVGTAIKVTRTVKNQGLTAAGAFAVGLYLSKDNVITSSDLFLGSTQVLSLEPATTSRAIITVTIPAQQEPGTYYLGAIADLNSSVIETKEGNNAKASSTSILINP